MLQAIDCSTFFFDHDCPFHSSDGRCAPVARRPACSTNPRYPDRPLVPRTVLVNPVVEPLGDAQEEDWEGCLSVPGLRGKVPRWARIRYRGFDPWGAPIDRTVDGFHARVVQHECDHLLGMLYPMRMRDLSQLGFTEVLFPGLEPTEND